MRRHISNRQKTGLRLCPSAIAVILTAVALLTACSRPEKTAGTFFTINDGGWAYGDTLVFNPKGDTILGASNDFVVSVRHTHEYAYANLWLEISYQTADTTAADTFNLTLADDYGKWLGSGSGPVILVSDTVRLRQKPTATSPVGVRHIMRIETLPDIEQIGIAPL